MFNLLKKIALYGIILLGVIYGYQYMTGKSITTLPRDVVNKFYEKGPAESTNPKYYKDPAKSLPKD
jgi:hypothetical protein